MVGLRFVSRLASSFMAESMVSPPYADFVKVESIRKFVAGFCLVMNHRAEKLKPAQSGLPLTRGHADLEHDQTKSRYFAHPPTPSSPPFPRKHKGQPSP